MSTRKQRKTAQILVENRGIAISKAMELAGYSKHTAKTPQKLTESKAWAETFHEAVTDVDLLEYHRQGLDAYHDSPRIIDRDKKGNPVYEYVQVPDFHARFKYLHEAYQLKGYLTDPQKDMSNSVINIALYEATPEANQHTISVQPSELPTAVIKSNGRRFQKGGDSMAQKKR